MGKFPASRAPLLAAGGTEAASTPVRFGQVLGELEVRRQIRGQNELGDAVAGLDGADCVAVIVQRDEDFAPGSPDQ